MGIQLVHLVINPNLCVCLMRFDFGTFYIFLVHMLLFFHARNMLQVARNYQAIANKNGSAGVSNNDAQCTCNMLVIVESQKYVFDSL